VPAQVTRAKTQPERAAQEQPNRKEVNRLSEESAVQKAMNPVKGSKMCSKKGVRCEV